VQHEWSTGPVYDVVPDGKEHPLPPSVLKPRRHRMVDSRTLEQRGQRQGKEVGSGRAGDPLNGGSRSRFRTPMFYPANAAEVAEVPIAGARQ
jgi:hypothetical protein